MENAKLLSIDFLKNDEEFIENIRWDITPKKFLPRSPSKDQPVDTTHGYMLYVDLVDDKPALMVMQLKYTLSKTLGYVEGVPEDLLREAMQCAATECMGGMYPLTEKIENWLKTELGIS
ncbi:MAG: hypothetical protein HY808_14820 [Nitrospirae bacterium]|nr:hypothetical protein [Nitrospirota bacterium]